MSLEKNIGYKVRDLVAITPDDDTDINIEGFIILGDVGTNIKLWLAGGSAAITIASDQLFAGKEYWWNVKRIYATTTDATGIYELKT